MHFAHLNFFVFLDGNKLSKAAPAERSQKAFSSAKSGETCISFYGVRMAHATFCKLW